MAKNSGLIMERKGQYSSENVLISMQKPVLSSDSLSLFRDQFSESFRRLALQSYGETMPTYDSDVLAPIAV
jgi:hypothetical protein